MSDKPISYQPTEGLTYDPSDPKYWDKKALNQEVERVFEVCHGCRMCFKYCEAFPKLFNFIDRQNGDVRKVSPRQTHQVMNACFQCKLCEVQCPYTPRDSHEFQLDFPKLVHRYQAQMFKKQKKASLQEKTLAEPYTAGKLARASFGMANKMNRVAAHRWFLEMLLGIHRKKLLPNFANNTFTDRAEKQGRIKKPDDKPEAVLFPTCYVDNNQPDVGFDAIVALEANKVNVGCAKGMDCCGMPHWEYGNLEALREKAIHNIKILLPYVEQGAKVLVVNPTCSMMMRTEYPELLSEEWKEKAQKLADATMDVTDYLWDIRREERFVEAKSQPEAKVSYHLPCHLRAQAKGFRGRDMVRKVGGVQTLPVMECCGHDGSYGMKVDTYESSIKVGQKSFDAMKKNEAEIWITDCPLAALQFEEHAGVKPMHPVSFLAKCYKENGFQENENEKS